MMHCQRCCQRGISFQPGLKQKYRLHEVLLPEAIKTSEKSLNLRCFSLPLVF